MGSAGATEGGDWYAGGESESGVTERVKARGRATGKPGILEQRILVAWLGKSRQVGWRREILESWQTGYWQLSWASLGKWAGDGKSWHTGT